MRVEYKPVKVGHLQCEVSQFNLPDELLNYDYVPFFSFFSFFFFFFFLTSVLSCWDFFMENSRCFPRGKPAATQSRYPTYGACQMFQLFHHQPNSDMDGIFNVHTDVNACDCTWGCANAITESAVKVDSGRKKYSLPGRGFEPALAACRSELYQLSYIPVVCFVTWQHTSR